jgi:beta-N-acetylhexosaminidase
MAGVIKYAGSRAQATLMAKKAGADLVLIKFDEKDTEECFNLVLSAVESGEISEEEIDRSVRRILKAKADIGILSDPLPDPEKTRAVLDDAANRNTCREVFRKGSIITRDRDSLLPLEKNARILSVEQYIPLYHEKCNDSHYHAGMFREFLKSYSSNVIALETNTPATQDDAERFRAKMEQADTVVFFNTFWRGSGSNRPLIREAAAKGKKVIVATNDLYDSYFLPAVGTVICTFGAVPQGLCAAADAVFGEYKPSGTWPLSLLKMEDTTGLDEKVEHFIAGHFSGR